MNDLFAPPDVDWTPVSPKLASMRRTVLAVSGAVLLAVLLVVGALLPSWRLVFLVVAGALLALVVLGWVVIGRNARSWGYSERDEDLFIKHGAAFRKLVAVPYGRMQFVDVTAGPVEQAFGIAGIHLHTASAGTNARIPGLPPAEAARLRDRLTELGEGQAAGL